ncbi:MAG: phosphoribosyltransferase [Candidatus Heimdallarchaeota archaeon]|nr:MAG: phosphoribosyltransferase [Candidatus Heimdallarchaeota archaeon]
MVKFKIVSWQDIDHLARKLFHHVKNDGFEPEIILGISRGGTIPARLLSDMFEAEIPFKQGGTASILATMQIKFYAGIAETHTQPVVAQDVTVEIQQKKILLVDDLVDSGESIQCALDYISLKNPKEVRIAALLAKPWSKVIPHYFVEETTEWVVFPHEYYEFMTERTISEGYDKAEAWATFIKLGIPDSSVSFFVKNFLS